MDFLFRKGKSGTDVVESLQTALGEDTKDSKDDISKRQDKLKGYMSEMKVTLYGDPEHEPKPSAIEALVSDLLGGDILLKMLENLSAFEFEGKKDIAAVFSYLLRRGDQYKIVEFIQSNPSILEMLVKGYDDSEFALSTGQVLRECIRHEDLCKNLLNSPSFYTFFEYCQKNNFEVASDAFSTFKSLLTKHKTLAADFLLENYDQVFKSYNELIEAENYVTKRQSLKLLGEILLDRKNFNIMIKYINDPENLKMLMILLRKPKKMIQFEAFHVFKVFVANPDKSKPVQDILIRNKTKLIEFLSDFQKDKDDDEQFVEEKNILLNSLESLPDPEEPAPPAAE